jgi:hypothetical protein
MSNLAPLLALLLPAQQPVLTEVASNPLDESSGEFVEIYNPSSTQVCLSGFSITDGDALDALLVWDEGLYGIFPHPGMLLGTDTLPPGSFALIFELDYLQSACYTDIPPGTLILTTGDYSICNGLAASSDPLTLFGPGGISDSSVVSTFGTPVPSDQWQERDDDGLDGIPFDPGDGATVERFPWSAPDQEGCWQAGPQGGTPGRPAEAPPDTLNISCDSVWTDPQNPEDGVPFQVAASFTCWGNCTPVSGTLTIFMDAEGDSAASPGEILAVNDASAMQPGTTDTLFAVTSREQGWYLPSSVADVQGDGFPDDDHACFPMAVGGGVDPVITEVMANPVDEDTGEYIELYYPGPGIFPLAGSSFTDGDALDGIAAWTLSPLADPDAVYSSYLPSVSFAVILDPEYADGIQYYDLAPGTFVATVGNTTLGNGLTGNDPLTFYDPGGTTQTSVRSTFGTPVASDDPLLCDDDGLDGIPFDAGENRSLERRSYAIPDAESSWVASPLGGTPGSPAQVTDTTDACIDSIGLFPQNPDPGVPVTLEAVVINSGTVLITNGSVTLFLDSDADSSASPEEILLTVPIGPLPPASGDSISVGFPCPAEGWYLAAATVEVPGDQDPSNDTILQQFRSGTGVDAVISEVLCNPLSEDHDEFIEIHYPGPGVFDLAGCGFTDGDAVDIIEAWNPESGSVADPDACAGTFLMAGAFGVVLDSEYAAGSQPYDYPPGTVIMTTGNTTLGDGLTGTDPLTLYGEGGTGSIDVMSTYGTPVPAEDPLGRDDDGADGIPSDPGEGQSLQRLMLSGPDQEDNWCMSPGGPTPGGPFPESYLGVNGSVLSVACDPPMGDGGQSGLLQARVSCTGTEPIPEGSLTVSWYCDLDLDGVPAPGELAGTAEAGTLDPGDTLEVQTDWTTVQQYAAVIAIALCNQDQTPSDDTASCYWNRTGPLVLNEIMYSPDPGEPEWIELLNVSGEPVNLSGWRFEDSAEQVILCLDSVTVAPDGFAVAVPDSAGFRTAWPGVTCPVIEPEDWPALNNSTQSGQPYADLLTLRDPQLDPADHVPYDDDWGGGAGVSLERLASNLCGWIPESWTGCGCGGTPGASNSCSSAGGEGGFLEYAPDPFSPDGDGTDDILVISIHPDGGQSEITLTVYNVQGRPVRELIRDEPCGSSRTLVWDGSGSDGCRLPLGRYILYLRARDTSTGEVREACAVVVLARYL